MSTGRSAPIGRDLLLLDRAQELRLEPERHLADLVEEEGTAARQLEVAPARLGRPGERAPAVAEELGLEQLLGDRGAVDGDERLLPPRAREVERPGEELLADARLAVDQHGRVELGDLVQEREDLQHLRALRDQVRQREPLLVAAERLAALVAQIAKLERPPQDQQDLVRLERLDQVVLGPEPGGLDGGADGAVRGHDDHADLRMLGLQPADDLDTVHARQPLVGQGEVDVLPLEPVQGLLPAARREHVEALELEGAPEGAQEDLVILDDEHSPLHPPPPRAARSRPASPAPGPRPRGSRPRAGPRSS